jgi:hypothetical protein
MLLDSIDRASVSVATGASMDSSIVKPKEETKNTEMDCRINETETGGGVALSFVDGRV